ncbi:hypothetical protein EDC01DRAFT_732646 [Geopyxis carbonaria]|nr:hypothetical protein EDC01DRAFT_732646 [Geopyxis carbonaria]
MSDTSMNDEPASSDTSGVTARTPEPMPEFPTNDVLNGTSLFSLRLASVTDMICGCTEITDDPNWKSLDALGPAIELLIFRVKTESSLEDITQTLWLNVLRRIYTELDEWIIAANLRTNTVTPDLAVERVIDYYGGVASRNCLVIECKRDLGDLQESAIKFKVANKTQAVAEGQLDSELTEAIDGTHVYGAAVHGLYIKFFLGIETRGTIHEPFAPLKACSEILNLQENPQQITWWLNKIKEHVPSTYVHVSRPSVS